MGTTVLSLSDRMKRYEEVSAWALPRRIPVILRIDGKAFHTLTRRYFGKNWSIEFVGIMIETAKSLMKEMQGCSFCYCQSDEISFLLTDYRTISTEPWFGYDARKMISISASTASAVFTKELSKKDGLESLYKSQPIATFDSRVFSIPHDEVVNYFVFRQKDATRNAIQMAGREYFSHKQLNNVSCDSIQEMLFQKHNINFDKYPVIRKRGFCFNPDYDDSIPIFSKDRDYVEKHVNVRED